MKRWSASAITARLVWVTAIALVLPANTGKAAAEEAAAPVASPAAGGLDLLHAYWRYRQVLRYPMYLDGQGQAHHYKAARYGAQNGKATFNLVNSEDVSGSWRDAAYDDSDWPIQRMPFSMNPDDETSEYLEVCNVGIAWVRKFCSRGRFFVQDPAMASPIRLSMEYYGGVIVHLNGEEVGRGHIPTEGGLAGKELAEGYVDLAYGPVTAEQVAAEKKYQIWVAPLAIERGRFRNLPESEQEQMRKVMVDLSKARSRLLTVELPRKFLKSGVNVLAIENRVSPVSPGVARGGAKTFPHVGVKGLLLKSGGAASIKALRPSHKPQVSTEDIHRWVFNRDYIEDGSAVGRVLRICGAKGGTYSAQFVIQAGAEDLGNSQVSISDFAGPGDLRIPATCARFRAAKGVSLAQVMSWRERYPYYARHPSFPLFFERYLGTPDGTGKAKADPSLQIFDHLSSDLIRGPRAGGIQPVWLTVGIPPDARPGLYQAVVAIQGQGLARQIPARLFVFDVNMPKPQDFVSYVGVEQSPWMLAKRYDVPLWSPRHWELVEASIRLCGELGARVVVVPIIQDSNLENGKDTMVRWIQKGSGFEYDYTITDRYLDLWMKYCRKDSDVLFHVVRGGEERAQDTGYLGPVLLSDGKPFRVANFQQMVDCCKSLASHYEGRGLKRSQMHWGLFHDWQGDDTARLADLLAESVPGVGWATARHDPYRASKTWKGRVSWSACVRGAFESPFHMGRAKGEPGKPAAFDLSTYRVKSGQGWKQPDALLSLGRNDNAITAVGLYPALWHLRSLQEMCISAGGKYGCKGFTRIVMDGWGRLGFFGPYISHLSYPGEKGPEGSVTLEILREGIQEAEMRICIERQGQASDGVCKMLDRRLERIYTLPCYPISRIGEDFHNWQGRSWDLYVAAAAAAAGGKVPSDEDKRAFFASADAR